MIGALAALFFTNYKCSVVIRQLQLKTCNWTVKAANHIKSTQPNPPTTELIIVTIKTGEFQKMEEFFTEDIVSTRNIFPNCIFYGIVMVMIDW